MINYKFYYYDELHDKKIMTLCSDNYISEYNNCDISHPDYFIHFLFVYLKSKINKKCGFYEKKFNHPMEV